MGRCRGVCRWVGAGVGGCRWIGVGVWVGVGVSRGGLVVVV